MNNDYNNGNRPDNGTEDPRDFNQSPNGNGTQQSGSDNGQGSSQNTYNQGNPYGQGNPYNQQYYGNQQQNGQFYGAPPQGMPFYVGQFENDMQGNAKATSAKNLGIAGLITSILCCCIPIVGLVLGILAVVNASSSKKLLGRDTPNAKTGRICGIIAIVLVGIVMVANFVSSFFVDEMLQEYEDFYSEYYEEYYSGEDTDSESPYAY